MSDEQHYQKGFNEGYIIAKHLPDLSNELAKVEPTTPRIEGFHDGRTQFVLEQTKEHRPAWMNPDRHIGTEHDKIKDRGKEPER